MNTEGLASRYPRYRKKPLVIEAIQWTGANVDELLDFIFTRGSGRRGLGDERNVLFIDTMEGTMRADPNDWIIKGIKGEFYPCKPDVFEVTYEPAALLSPAEGLLLSKEEVILIYELLKHEFIPHNEYHEEYHALMKKMRDLIDAE